MVRLSASRLCATLLVAVALVASATPLEAQAVPSAPAPVGTTTPVGPDTTRLHGPRVGRSLWQAEARADTSAFAASSTSRAIHTIRISTLVLVLSVVILVLLIT